MSSEGLIHAIIQMNLKNKHYTKGNKPDKKDNFI